MSSTVTTSLIGYALAVALMVFDWDGALGWLGFSLAAVLTLILVIGLISGRDA